MNRKGNQKTKKRDWRVMFEQCNKPVQRNISLWPTVSRLHWSLEADTSLYAN